MPFGPSHIRSGAAFRRRFRSLVAITACLIAALPLMASAADEWLVYNLGLSDVPTLRNATAEPNAPPSPVDWKQTNPALIPTDFSQAGLVCIQTSFADDAHVILMRYADGELMAAQTVSFHKIWNGNAAVWQWVLPLPTIEHAAKTVATRDAEVRDDVRLTIHPWPSADEAPKLDAHSLEVSASADSLGGVDIERLLAVFRPMITAAAMETGHRPRADAAAELQVELGSRKDACDIRVHFDGRSVEMHYVPHAQAYDAIVKMMHLIRTGPSIIGLVRPSTAASELVGTTGDTMLVNVGGYLRGMDRTTGRLLWPIPLDSPRWQPPLAVALNRPGQPSVPMQLNGRAWGLLNPQSGEVMRPLAGKPPAAERVTILPDGRVCFAVGQELVMINAESELWRSELATPVAAGPVVAGDGVAVVCTDGGLVLVDSAGKAAAPRPSGIDRPTRLLALNSALAVLGLRQMAVLPAGGGEPRSLHFGDSIKQVLPLPGGGMVVRTGDNVIHSFSSPDAEPTTRRWPTWIRGMSLLTITGEPRLAIADMAGDMTILSTVALETQRSLSFGVDLLDAPRAMSVTVPWPPVPNGPTGTPVLSQVEEPDPMSLQHTFSVPEPRPVLLLSDRSGYIYFIDPELP